MKPSLYNIIYDISNSSTTYLFFNTFSNNFVFIKDKEDYEIICDILDNPNNKNNLSQKHKKMKNDLFKRGFLIEDLYDELEILSLKNKMSKYNFQTLFLTICTTDFCNFKCSYCFEKQKSTSYLNESLESEIVTFVEKTFDNFKHKYLRVTWFGGEPLLNFKSIIRLSKKFIEICRNKDIEYYSDIVTNGYLLNREKIEQLKEIKIKHFQITLDGDKDTHNRRRQLKNGNDTYDKIINNIKCLTDYYDKYNITLRVNIDNENINSSILLIEDLIKNNLKNKIDIKYKPIDNMLGNYNYCKNHSFDKIEWCKSYIDLLEKTFKLGWDIDFNELFVKKGFYCAAQYFNSIVINSNGNIYKCIDDIGEPEMTNISNLNKDKNLLLKINSKSEYINYEPFLLEGCRKCKILPLCNGGCPKKSIFIKENKGYCKDIKYILKDILILQYRKFIKSYSQN